VAGKGDLKRHGPRLQRGPSQAPTGQAGGLLLSDTIATHGGAVKALGLPPLDTVQSPHIIDAKRHPNRALANRRGPVLFGGRTEVIYAMTRTTSGPRQRRLATTITLPTATWERLLKMAAERASSVSRVVEQLVEKEDAHDANRDQNG